MDLVQILIEDPALRAKVCGETVCYDVKPFFNPGSA